MYRISLLATSQLALQFLYSKDVWYGVLGSCIVVPMVIKAWKGIEILEEIEAEVRLSGS